MKKVTKITEIKNLAVFKNFKWDSLVKNKDGKVEVFKDINIFYGRNYSGKTTLSKIFRAFETGSISDKYENPEFKILFDDNTSICQNNLADKQNFRVFNSDFIDENLSFLRNSEDGKIQPFAIVGEGNKKLIPEIEKLQNELGNKKEDEKTGLYKELDEKSENYITAQKLYRTKSNDVEKRLTDKARDMKNACRNFVDASYNINSIKKDIETVFSQSFSILSEQDVVELKKVLQEEVKSGIQKANDYDFKYNELVTETKDLLLKKVESADKIQELVENALLNNWVKKGLELHTDREKCAFCGQVLPEGRISLLQHHFNEEMDVLQKEIDDEISKIESEKNDITNKYATLKESDLYVKYQEEAKSRIKIINQAIKSYIAELDKLVNQLKEKKEKVFNEVQFVEPNDVIQSVLDSIGKYNELIDEAIKYGNDLQTEKNKAKETLRLNIVTQFLSDIKYQDLCTEITNLSSDANTKKTDYENFQSEIIEKEKTLESKKTQLNDEKKGANKVNEYLSHFFGHDFLQLVPIEEDSETEDIKHYRFEIQRNGKQAFNLSEGECRLVAFSYFMAKLNDTQTANQKPIIWIDDPICSLDANHVFFVYSLISAEIAIRDSYEQLFITTHNLDFLKYLLRLKGKYLETDKDKQKNYFLVERKNDVSELILMPKYMKKHASEFNYLFNNIYQCATTEINDETYPLFYNFSNNARKFLEVYLFYKFPDFSDDRKKQEAFFGTKIPVFLNERVTNEYSHLAGGIERATTIVEYPVETMKKDAQLILDCIKNRDAEQYTALLNSVGVQQID